MDLRAYCESCDRWFTCVVQPDLIICGWCGQPPIRLQSSLTRHGQDEREPSPPLRRTA